MPSPPRKRKPSASVDGVLRTTASAAKKPRSTRDKNGRSTGESEVVLAKVTIQVSSPDPQEDPIVVSFPGGIPKDSPEFLWSQLAPKMAAGRSLLGQGRNGTVYKATSQGLGYDARRTKLCVGIYDKHTGILTLHQAASKGTVYALQPHLPSYQEELQPEAAAGSNLQLFADFGSNKKKKSLKSQQANRVSTDAVIGTATADAIAMSVSNRQALEVARQAAREGTTAPGAAEDAHEDARQRMLPPFYRDAEAPCHVYDFASIVGDEGWGAICRIVDACLRKDDFLEAITRGRENDQGTVPPPEERGWLPSVLECLTSVQKKGIVTKAQGEDSNVSKSASSAKHQLRCILLYHYMAKFYCRFVKGARSSQRSKLVPGMDETQSKWYGIPRPVAVPLLATFSSVNDVPKQQPLLPEDTINTKPEGDPNLPRHVMYQQDKYKCLIQLLLVSMLAKGGATMEVKDLTTIIHDVESDVKEVTTVLRMAGCTVTANGQRTGAKLTMPLKFPKPKRNKAPKR